METNPSETRRTEADTIPAPRARSNYTRSAAAKHSPYSTRRSASTRRGAKSTKEPWSFKEKFLLQTTICGVFLAILLFFNVIDSSFTNGVTAWVDENFSYSMSMDSVTSAGGDLSSFVDSVKTMFVKTNTAPEIVEAGDQSNAEAVTNIQLQNVQEETFLDSPALYEPSVDATRIDEDMLNEINNREDIYNDTYNAINSDAKNE